MMALTERDLDILESLTRRVRLLAIDQVRRIWWPSQQRNRIVRQRLASLVAAGLIERSIINVHPLLPVAEPLSRWHPGLPEPEALQISRAARSRWNLPAEPTEVFTASRQSANLLGSSAGRLPKRLHCDHDLLLSQVYLRYRLHRPLDAARWLGEDALPKAGYRTKDPDAFLLGDDGRPFRVIESTGRYAPAQILSFHEHCFEYDLPYELW